MQIEFSVPSKTFLFGEYGVLQKYPAVILNTAPRFRLMASTGDANANSALVSESLSLHPESVAGKWYRSHEEDLKGWMFKFVDPHSGGGGFGASGAEFVMLHAMTRFLKSSVLEAARGYDSVKMWQDFQQLNEGRSSGADVLGQVAGGAARIDVATGTAVTGQWPFSDLAFVIAKTGIKIPTHQHLEGLDRQHLEVLKGAIDHCQTAFLAGSSEDFVTAIQDFSLRLNELGLVTSEVANGLNTLRQDPRVLAAKGCGAYGADTVLILVRSEDRETGQELLKLMGWIPVSTDLDLDQGLRMDWKFSDED